MATESLCSVGDCIKPARTRGMCAIHYNRLWRTGDAGGSIKKRGEPLRWMHEHVSYVGSECLMWPFQRNNVGYAVLSSHGGKASAARYMCSLVNGEPPDPSFDTAHSCGKGADGCVHPKHVSWKTRAGNMQDAITHGTTTRGTKNAQSVLSEGDVRAIRALQGTMMYKEIAPLFRISPAAVGLIMRRERWAWLT
jgi:hypothetical protein